MTTKKQQKLKPLIAKFYKLNQKYRILKSQVEELRTTLINKVNEGSTTIPPYKITKLLIPTYIVEEHKAGGYFKLEVRKI